MNTDTMKCAVARNLEWFRRSGIMVPADGWWGVGERLLITGDNQAMTAIDAGFPLRTPLKEHLAVVENRRADCCAECALLFDLAAEHFGDASLKNVADNLLGFLLNRSGLLFRSGPKQGLWAWVMQNYAAGTSDAAWSDDNTWVAVILMMLARDGRPELREPGLALTKTLRRHIVGYLDFLDANGREANYDYMSPMMGMRLNPHWLGLTTLAFSWAYVLEPDERYRELTHRIFDIMPDGPPKWDTLCHVEDAELPWAVSEYAYLMLEGTVAANAFGDERFLAVASASAATLEKRRNAFGSFVSNHHEAPRGDHFADLIYTHNWALLGLVHLAALKPDDALVREMLDDATELVLQIQDTSSDDHFRGCWRGMYDCSRREWGGGDKHEGGANSIYSGWTNAPISIALLFQLTGKSLFPRR